VLRENYPFPGNGTVKKKKVNYAIDCKILTTMKNEERYHLKEHWNCRCWVKMPNGEESVNKIKQRAFSVPSLTALTLCPFRNFQF
jgi:hypothetical protein